MGEGGGAEADGGQQCGFLLSKISGHHCARGRGFVPNCCSQYRSVLLRKQGQKARDAVRSPRCLVCSLRLAWDLPSLSWALGVFYK